MNNKLSYYIDFKIISYIQSLFIIIIFSDSHNIYIDLKHSNDKYKLLSNDYSKHLLESYKRNNIVNDIITDHTIIIADVRNQMIEIKNELILLNSRYKPKISSPTLSIKSLSTSSENSPTLNYELPKIKSNSFNHNLNIKVKGRLSEFIDSKSCIF